MRDPTVNRDAGAIETGHQETIFDSAGICRQLDCLTSRRNLCRWEADREAGAAYTTRPRGCIAAPDPSTEPIPF